MEGHKQHSVVVMSFPLPTSTYHRKVPGSPACSLWLSVGRNGAVPLLRLPHPFLCLQGSCLALNGHGSGAGVSWEGTSHLPPAEGGDEGNLLHGHQYPPSCPAGCMVAMEGHPNVAHSLCSAGAQLFLSWDRQSRVGAVSWQTPTGTSLLCSGLIGCPRVLGAAAGSWPTLHSVHAKNQHEGAMSL